ncbi:MAG: ArnT family glycosyltransferase [Spirochaetota bacterium]
MKKPTVEKYLLPLLLLSAAIFYISVLDIFSTNGDPVDYWRAARRFFCGNGNIILHHRHVRFGIIVPVFFMQRIFSDHFLVYYATSLLVLMSEIWLVFLISRKLFDSHVAWFSSIIFLLFPMHYVHGYAYSTNLYPAPFSALYILASLYLICSYLDSRKTVLIIVSALLAFIAYETKVTNVYFYPAFAFILWKNKRDLVLFFGVLFLLFAVETVLYASFTDYTLGRAGLLMNTHLSQEKHVGIGSFLSLLNRFVDLKFPYLFILVPFLFSCALYIHAARARNTTIIFSFSVSFLVCLTFAVKSIDPVIPVERFNDRVFNTVLPFLVIFTVKTVRDALASMKIVVTDRIFRKIVIISQIALLVFSAVFAAVENRSHTLFRSFRYHALLNDALKSGTPVVALDRSAISKAFGVAQYILMDRCFILKTGRGKTTVSSNGRSAVVHYLDNGETREMLENIALDDPDVVVIDRTPFTAQKTKLGTLLEEE